MKYLLLLILTTTYLLSLTLDDAKKLYNQDKKYKEALIIFNKHPQDSEALLYIGRSYSHGLGINKDTNKAIGYYQKAIKYGDSKIIASCYYELASLYMLTNDYDKVIDSYHKAIKNGDQKTLVYFHEQLAGTYSLIKDYKKSIVHYNKAIQNATEVEKIYSYTRLADIYYYNIKDYDKAIEYYIKTLRYSNEKEKTYSYTRLADIYYYNIKDYDKAIEYYKASSKLGDEDSTSTLFNNYINNTKEFSKAIELANKSYKEGNFNIGCQLAYYYSYSLGKTEEELFTYNPKKSYTLASSILIQEKKYSTSSMCYLALANIYLAGNYVAQDFKKSIELYRNVYELDNSLTDIPAVIASTYLELQDYENASIWYKTAYQGTKDASYLNQVEKYKKLLFEEQVKKPSDIEQKVYPVIDNFTNITQVTARLQTKKYYFLAVDQKYINMYDKKTLKLEKTFRAWIGKSKIGRIHQMTYDENKELLYIAGSHNSNNISNDSLIRVFDIKTGKIIKVLNSKNSWGSAYLNISTDGKYLISMDSAYKFNIINTSNNQIQHYNFQGIMLFTHANIIKKGNDYHVNILGQDKNLYTFSINQKKQILKEKFTYNMDFKPFNDKEVQSILDSQVKRSLKVKNLSINNKQLYIEFKNTKRIKKFDFNNLSISDTYIKNNFIPKNNSHIKLKYINANTSAEIYKNKELISSICMMKEPILKHLIIKNKYIILSTKKLGISIFNLKGKLITRLKGFRSIQKNIIYQNEYLMTFGKDNVIHLWNLDNLHKLEKQKSSYDSDALYSINKFFSFNALDIIAMPDQDLIGFLKNYSKQHKLSYIVTPKQYKSYIKNYLLKKEVILPLASLYIKNDKWIIYNHKGHFTSSNDGMNLIKYHLNQGLKKESTLISNEQVFEKFYRPDILQKLLAKEIITDNPDINKVLQNINPPLVNILSKKFKDSKNLELIYKICDAGSGISNTSILLNNIQNNISNTRGFSIEKQNIDDDKCTIYKNIITLQSGKNTIAIRSFDKSMTISKTTNEIEVVGKFNKPKKSNLHFLSIAVANYRDSTLQLKYSVSDVTAVKEKLLKHSHNLFKNIFVYDLHEKQVTLKNIDKVFDSISKKMDINDVFILYIAGHGITSIKDGLYYFLPYNITDTSSKGLVDSAVSVNDIKYQLGKIRANKSLILLDTCESGGAIDTLASRGLEQRMALERLSYATGRNYIVASSKNQAALEGYKNHGVFTYSVLQAFDNAYFGSDTTLTVTSLASFVEKTVPKISKEKFHYEQFPQKYLNGNDFPIGVK